MVELKYAAKRFGVMSVEERDLAANKLIIAISLITGWTIPASPDVMDMLVQQLAKKMEEKYQNLNEEEVEYVFRNKGIEIKDWGKALNLALLDEAIAPYLENRFDLSMQEEKLSMQLPKNEQNLLDAPKMTDADWEEWLQSISSYPINKIPCDSYDYLTRTGKIVLTKEQKHGYMERAIGHYEISLPLVSKEESEFLKMKEAGIYNHQVTGSLITISKRLAVYDYFNNKTYECPEEIDLFNRIGIPYCEPKNRNYP